MIPAFLTIKWGNAFDADTVNILKRAALANCSQRVRFVCLTDRVDGLDSDIETYPIPAFDLYVNTPRAGIWPKVSLFHPDLQDIIERTVFLDLDTVVTGSLDELFDEPSDDLVMLSCGQRWKKMDEVFAPEPATGVMTYNMSAQAAIFTQFASDPVSATTRYNLEQEFVGAAASTVRYYQLPWIQSFKYHLRRQPLFDLVLPPKAPAAHTKLVAFHGFPRPSDVAKPGQRWARTPRCGLHRPKWLTEYWRTYGTLR